MECSVPPQPRCSAGSANHPSKQYFPHASKAPRPRWARGWSTRPDENPTRPPEDIHELLTLKLALPIELDGGVAETAGGGSLLLGGFSEMADRGENLVRPHQAGGVQRGRDITRRYGTLKPMSGCHDRRPPRLLRYQREPLGHLSSGGNLWQL